MCTRVHLFLEVLIFAMPYSHQHDLFLFKLKFVISLIRNIKLWYIDGGLI